MRENVTASVNNLFINAGLTFLNLEILETLVECDIKIFPEA